MADIQLRLADDEQEFLTGLLEKALKDMLVEEHRTRHPSYRENVLRQEKLIAGILDKVHASR